MEETDRRAHEWEEVFLKSFLFFWPHIHAKTKLLIVLDEEQTKGSEEIENRYKAFTEKVKYYATEKMPPFDSTGSNTVPTDKKKILIKTNNYPEYWYRQGHDRQQLLMLYADEFIDERESEFVGFVDTDCEFVTYVDREDLFEDGKPVINGRIGPIHDWTWYHMPGATQKLLGLDEPMRCMAYFPVILKIKHIREMREYIEKRHGGKSLREHLFPRMNWETKSTYSQFSFMCAYLWHFHREEYVWYASDTDPSYDLSDRYEILPGYWVDPPFGTIANKSIFTKQMLLPKPRVAIHTNYEKTLTEDLNREILKRGYCLSPPFPNQFCDMKELLKLSDVLSLKVFSGLRHGRHSSRSKPPEELVTTMPMMHRFEDGNYWSIYSMEVLRAEGLKRYRRLKNCPHDSWDYSIYNMSAYPLKVGN
jgi:hypothetical protein